jgi:hypothetical protein
MGLGKFLERKVLLGTSLWTEGSLFTVSRQDPFRQLISNPSNLTKLKGYRWFRADMEITVSISAAPTLFSALHVAYVPLDSATNAGNSYGFPMAITGSATGHAVGSDLIGLCQRSSCPYSGWVYPQEGSSLTLTIPFIYPLDWYDLLMTPTTFGTLMMESPMSLRSVGTASTNVASISVYARFFNVSLAGPTNYDVAQSSTLKGASKDLSRMGFGSASAWANLASHAARIVGLSNPPQIEPPTHTVPRAFPNLSCVDTADDSQIMTMGKHPVLASDPSTESDDELNIAKLAAIPSFVALHSWTVSKPVGEAVGTFYVTPSTFMSISSTGANANVYQTIYPSVSCYVGTMFTHWRGTMCYRFKVLASQYHRGKLRFYYDSGYFPNATPTEGYCPSVILDLAESTEAVIRVPMNSSLPWLRTKLQFNGGAAGALVSPIGSDVTLPTETASRVAHNGSIRYEVSQQLTCPDRVGNVQIIVETWMEDAQFANPTSMVTTAGVSTTLIDPYQWQSGCIVVDDPITQPPDTVVDVPQSGVTNVGLGTELVVHDLTGSSSKGRGLEHAFGEDITSLRALIHRVGFYRTITPPQTLVPASGPTSGVVDIIYCFPRIPRPLGQEFSSTAGTFTSLASGGPAYNFVQTTNFTRVGAMFHGFKGSLRWKAIARSPERVTGSPSMMTMSRSGYTPSVLSYRPTGTSASLVGDTARNCTGDYLMGLTVAGTGFVNVSGDFHDSTVVAFQPTAPYDKGSYIATLTTNAAYSLDQVQVNATFPYSSYADLAIQEGAINLLCGACPNMRFCHFKCAPAFHYLTSNPFPAASASN